MQLYPPSGDGKAAIYCDLNLLRMRCQLAKRGLRFVAIYCGPYLIVSTYVTPSIGLRDFNTFLDELSGALIDRADKIIIGGDFNAKSCLWGSRNNDRRGMLLSSWAAERDLRTANVMLRHVSDRRAIR